MQIVVRMFVHQVHLRNKYSELLIILSKTFLKTFL
jgi:hypothetical protein